MPLFLCHISKVNCSQSYPGQPTQTQFTHPNTRETVIPNGDDMNHTHTIIQAFSMREHHFGICALCSNLLQHYIYYTRNTLAYQQLQLGSVSYKMSLTLCVMLSGNFTSNETMRSPFRLGSLGNGSP